MICVTHDPRDADYLANRLWYLVGRSGNAALR